MALNEDDKKFIKKTVNDAVDKKTTSFEKAASNDKSSRLKAQIEERKERQEYIKQLKELQSNGETTMAQKFELMKEEINSKISKDIKNTVTDTINTVGKGARTVSRGANKAVSGVDGILTRMANIDPVLAALYAGTKGVSKDLWNIGAGGLQALVGGAQMAWGGAKAVGGLVGSTMNSMRNLYIRRKRQKQETPQQDIELDTPIPVSQNEEQQTETETEIQLPSLFPQKEEGSKSLIEMQNKIKDIHQAVVKEEKKNKESQLKSLAGLQKTMESINGVMAVLKAKQALIVTGVVLGVAALIGLAAWFKGGAFAKLLQIANPESNPESGENRTNNTTDVANSSGLNPETNIAVTNQMVKPGTSTKQVDQQQANLWDWVKSPIESRKMAKKYNFSGATSDLLGESVHLAHGGLNGNIKTYKNEGNIKIAFPVAIKMLDVRFDESQGMGASALIEKAEVTKGVKERLRYATGTSPRLIVTNIKKLLIPKKQVIKPNTTLFIVGEEYQLIGDVSAFMRGDTYENYTNKNNTDSSQIDKNYIEQAKEDKFSKALVNSEKDYMNQASFQQAMEETYSPITAAGKAVDNLLDAKAEEDLKKEQTTPGELQDGFDQATAPDKPVKGIPTGGAAPITSENEQKVQTQNEQLKEATKQQPTEDKGYVGEKPDLGKTQINLQEPGTNGQDIWSNMPTHMDYGLMARQQRNNSIL